MSKLCVQFGSGSNIIDGWVNTEFPHLDITKPLPYVDNSVDEAMAEHLVEHVSTPDFFRFLLDCHRILKHDGTLYLCVPVLDRVEPDHARDLILGHGHLAAYTIDSLRKIVSLAPFRRVLLDLNRPAICGHWKIIGIEKDEKETCRLLCVK